MIQSRHNTFGLWFLAIVGLFFLIIVISCLTQYYFNIIIIKIDIKNSKDLFWQILLAFTGLLIIICFLWTNAKIITIDHYNKRIAFKNLFIRTTKIYSFDELDGYIDTIVRHYRSFTPYKTLALIKDKRVVRKIDSFYYSNVHEMQNGLKELKYLGFIKFNFIKSIKAMFNYQILD